MPARAPADQALAILMVGVMSMKPVGWVSFQVLQRVKTDKTFDQSNDMKGVAIDSQGNIFKIAF